MSLVALHVVVAPASITFDDGADGAASLSDLWNDVLMPVAMAVLPWVALYLLATIVGAFLPRSTWHPTDSPAAARIAPAAAPAVEPPVVPAATAATVADVRRELDALLAAWGAYQLDTEAWYLTKPLLHDVTGLVQPTVAYHDAMAALDRAVEELTPESSHEAVSAAMGLADSAWAAWYAANDHAAAVGLDDRTPSERAALQRLSRLVERFVHTVAGDPELPALKASIQRCLDRVHTVSVSWSDIAKQPAVVAAKTLPALTA